MTSTASLAIFRLAVIRLHKAKSAAYRNAWKRRGEVVSVIANIARKIDRLEAVADGAPTTPDESLLDTVVDLLVYSIKYQTFLADLDEFVARTLFQHASLTPPYSDGTDGFEALLSQTDLTCIERPRNRSLSEATAQVLNAFAAIEAAVVEPVESANKRADYASALVAATVNLLGVLRLIAPDSYDGFISITLGK